MVCLIVRERHSKREPYSEIPQALLTTVKHTNTMQHNPSPAFLLSCIQVPVSSERCRKKTSLPAKNSWIFPRASVAALMSAPIDTPALVLNKVWHSTESRLSIQVLTPPLEQILLARFGSSLQ